MPLNIFDGMRGGWGFCLIRGCKRRHAFGGVKVCYRGETSHTCPVDRGNEHCLSAFLFADSFMPQAL